MAPFLFLLVAKGFTWLFRKVTKKNLYCGVRVGNKETEVGLLQFVDDTLFMSDASIENLWGMKTMLRSFELVLGLQLNFPKTKIGGMRLNTTLI